jgi:radical SAM-linked protein
VISRGDRRVGRLLAIAHQLGCRFDGWSEHLDWGRWEEAFRRWEAETGGRAADQLRARPLDEPLPWDHIDILVRKEWLQEDYRRSRGLLWEVDCRRSRCHQCGVIDRERDLCATMLRRSHRGRREEEGNSATRQLGNSATRQLGNSDVAAQLPNCPIAHSPLTTHHSLRAEEDPVQRLRFRFAKRGSVRLLSHLETMDVFIRALRRAHVPMAYSQGFHPQPRLAFGTALATGIESEGEYADLLLTARLEPEDFVASVNATLPEGFAILAAWEAPLRAAALMSEIHGAEYRLRVPADLARNGSTPLTTRLADYLARDEVLVERPTKKGVKTVNIRPMITQLRVWEETEEQATFQLRLMDHQGQSGKPVEVLTTLLGLGDGEWHRVRVQKVDSFTREGVTVS